LSALTTLEGLVHSPSRESRHCPGLIALVGISAVSGGAVHVSATLQIWSAQHAVVDLVAARAVALVLAVFLVSTAYAEDHGNPVTGEAKTAFLTTWGERLRGMRSLHMVFTQEKHLRLLRQALVAQGELWLKGETLLYVLTNTAGKKN
jgi:hypothetical protein